jgi:hypothetical protein
MKAIKSQTSVSIRRMTSVSFWDGCIEGVFENNQIQAENNSNAKSNPKNKRTSNVSNCPCVAVKRIEINVDKMLSIITNMPSLFILIPLS